MQGSINQKSLITYIDILQEVILKSKLFDKVVFLDGNFIDYAKHNVNNINKPVLFVSTTSGVFEEINVNSIGLYDTITINFALIARSGQNNINTNDKTSKNILLTTLYELIKLLYNDQSLKNETVGKLSFGSHSYATNDYLSKNNLNMLTFDATHKMIFLSRVQNR